MSREVKFESALGPYMEMLISEKRALGYKYKTEEVTLLRFDKYWIKHCKNQDDVNITQESLCEWMTRTPNQSKSYHGQKVSTIRQLTVYMKSLGIRVYIPMDKVGKEKVMVHVFDRKEIKELFDVIDRYSPSPLVPMNKYFSKEYPVIFRLILTSGLRCGEACSIRTEDIDFDNKTILILNAKGNKDRLIYLSDDMHDCLKNYIHDLSEILGFYSYWLFPGKNPDTHISVCGLEQIFRKFCNQASFNKTCEKPPTIHCLRHTFVVMKINEWMAEERNVEVMLPYLSKYLGHKNPSETFYYYHMINEAFSSVRKIDTLADRVIPEVRRI